MIVVSVKRYVIRGISCKEVRGKLSDAFERGNRVRFCTGVSHLIQKCVCSTKFQYIMNNIQTPLTDPLMQKHQ